MLDFENVKTNTYEDKRSLELKNFLKMRKIKRRHTSLRKFNFLLSAKQKSRKKNARWRWGLGVLTNGAWNQRPYLKIPSAQVKTWQVAPWSPGTCSACLPWFTVFLSLHSAARQLRWCLDKVTHSLSSVSWTLVPGGGEEEPCCCWQRMAFISFLSLVVQNLFCSSFSFNLVKWQKSLLGPAWQVKHPDAKLQD